MMNTRTNVAEHAPGMAGWLCLAASPVLAAMALLTVMSGGAMADVMCMTQASQLSGMVPMYLLMSLFHAGPWLRVMAGFRRTTD